LPLPDRDPAYLWDMLEAAQTLRELIAGLSVAAYLADRKTQLAVERAIEILGEAARRVSAEGVPKSLRLAGVAFRATAGEQYPGVLLRFHLNPETDEPHIPNGAGACRARDHRRPREVT
jgi:Protein of unknown function DUF86